MTELINKLREVTAMLLGYMRNTGATPHSMAHLQAQVDDVIKRASDDAHRSAKVPSVSKSGRKGNE